MTIEEILKLLQDPATIPDALKEAAKLPFSTSEQAKFNQKREKYQTGLSDYDRLIWIREMTDFLNGYDSGSGYFIPEKNNTLNPCLSRDYKSDKLNRWHHLDKREMKKKFKELYRTESKLKVIFIENNTEALSLRIHDVLYSFHSVHYGTIGKIKGNPNDDFLDLTHSDSLQDEWTEFVQHIFGIYVPFHQIPEEFIKSGFHKQSHFIVQSVDHFCFENFQVYFNFWTMLKPEQPLFLFFHMKERSFDGDTPCDHFLVCYHNQNEHVDKLDFKHFFTKYNCYHEDTSLYKCKPMTFRKAVERLQFNEKEN
jgi:hypothetical protein